MTDRGPCSQVEVSPGTDEYQIMSYEANNAMGTSFQYLRIKRFYHHYDINKFLIKENKELVGGTLYHYRGRRFIKIDRRHLDEALLFNLDHQRCNLEQPLFQRTQTQNYVIPNHSDEYFIEYVIIYV
ncbi:uncharacterized protein LOC126264390 [Aethina tumida]|uniref:uncharacterized protein LOC126264390 n=1 Tax=Aethina tumida TaxID=116153 RepID=UPI00214927F2|nr:uncharacterized protein LOC126264390 [Aethina tumida]